MELNATSIPRNPRHATSVSAALLVMVRDPKIRAWLEANDPQALYQAERALSAQVQEMPQRAAAVGLMTGLAVETEPTMSGGRWVWVQTIEGVWEPIHLLPEDVAALKEAL